MTCFFHQSLEIKKQSLLFLGVVTQILDSILLFRPHEKLAPKEDISRKPSFPQIGDCISPIKTRS